MFSSISRPKLKISLIALLVLVLATGTLSAADVSEAVTTVEVTVVNTSTTQTNVAVPFALSTQSFVDGGYVNTTVLNSAIQETGSDLPYMPASKLLTVKSAQSYDPVATTYTDQTADFNDATTQVELPGGALDDTLELALQYRSRVIRFNISAPAVAVYTITWEYHNGSSWSPLSNVIDNTSGFTVAGITTVAFDVPTDWAYYNHPTHAIEGYWIRARVSAFTSQTTMAQTYQGSHETGRWWNFLTSVEQDVAKTVKMYFGGPDMQTYFNYFPGSAGVITPDATSLEPSTTFKWDIDGYFDMSTGASKDIINKAGAVRLFVSDTDELTFTMTGTGLYSVYGTTNDAYMERLEINYTRALQETEADNSYIIGNIKVGLSYDKDIETTPAFGDKIADPS